MARMNMANAAQLNQIYKNRPRSYRRPVHTHQVRYRPFEITPFMVAPVLAGETLKNLMLQARIVSDPIDNFLLGAWAEHFYFYCKLRDFTAIKSDVETMLLDPSSAFTAADSTTAATTNYNGGTSAVPRWLNYALDQIVKFYFRTPEEVEDGTWDDYVGSGSERYVAAIKNRSFWDSAVGDTAYLASISPDQTLTVGGDDSFTMRELEDKMNVYLWEQQYGFIGGKDLSFEEWLAAQGIRVPGAQDDTQEGMPEVIRYSFNWTYPVNTVNPSDGNPSTAWSWSVRERADKDRFFTEPGFIVGVTLVRPKVYLSKQTHAGFYMLDSAKDWFPALLEQNANFSMKKFATDTAPMLDNNEAIWIDIKDLFLYGDQFINFSLAATDAGLVALPTAAMQKRYPSTTDVDNLFATKTAGVGKVYQDGVTTLMIKGRIGRDTSASISKG